MESPLRDRAADDLKVIETLRYERGAGFVRLKRHLARCGATCARLGVDFDPGEAKAALAAAAAASQSAGEAALRLRLTVDLRGRVAATAAPLPRASAETVWRLALSGTRLDPDDPWLAVKTTERRLYDAARAALPRGVDEILFANRRDALAEGAVTNVFADFGSGLVTPPLSAGLLPGVLRAELLETGACREETIPLGRLAAAQSLYVGNSLRGLIRAEMA